MFAKESELNIGGVTPLPCLKTPRSAIQRLAPFSRVLVKTSVTLHFKNVLVEWTHASLCRSVCHMLNVYTGCCAIVRMMVCDFVVVPHVKG